ncbi:conserved hypothetical protein [Histoplasma capsulatum G186AR]|uniref:Major facilitator superfamily (MFS) profile domain-containing protein n=1 Tax=Ajellomyces capsulatus (strain G186AR / H82 / ATCC MYA-2454 / RMSCC 2432) TaxID=447093 RepID=C0NJC4_AJECG|nr:uncharacterized protein HCBG_03254 [Histoplasma capsulatum G186AR]EEH07965.1 conserved hypothetical protein [Histoplasma capsulatum G186AR]
MARGSKLPWGLSFRSSEWFILLVVSAALFTIVPIVPLALTDRADVPQGDALFGYFADRGRSRQLPFVMGLVAMILATSLFLVGRSPGLFVVARAMQGLSGGAVGAVGMALAVDTVPKERIGQAMGYVSLALTWGVLFGPIVGGVMFTKAGYYAAFAVPIALLCIDIVLRLLMIEKKVFLEDGKLIWRVAVANRWLHHIVGARNHTDSYDHPSPPGSSSRTQSLGSDSEDTIDEQSPLIQPSKNGNSKPTSTKALMIYHLLKDSRILVNLFATVIQSIVWTAFETTLPIFVMDKFNWTPSGTGILFLIFALPCLFGVLIGKGVDRWGSRVFGTFGFILAGPPLILLRLVQHNTTGQQITLGALLVLVGLAITVVQVITMTEISHAVDELEERDPVLFSGPGAMGQGYALYNMAFAAGQLLGPIIGGFVITSFGWAGMNLALGLICFASAVPMAIFCGGTITSQKGKLKVRDLSGGGEAYES